MGIKIENVDAAEAQRRLAVQIEPRLDRGSGARDSDGNYEEASAEMRRLEDEEQLSHGPPSRA